MQAAYIKIEQLIWRSIFWWKNTNLRKYLFVLISICSSFLVCAQDFKDQKYDRQIIVTDKLTTGCLNLDSTDKIYRIGTLFDWNTDILLMTATDTNRLDGKPPKYWVMTTSTQISNKEGRFLAYYNGKELWDRYGEPIPLIVFGSFPPEPYESIHGYSNCLILPWPTRDSNYILLAVNNYQFDPIYFTSSGETITLIKFKESKDGKIEITGEEKDLFSSKFTLFGSMSACRHANGRDWWIVMPYRHEAAFHVFLLDPSGVRWHHTQQMESPILDESRFPTFSPDGRYYTRTDFEHTPQKDIDHVQIFPFDRCDGLFSEPYSFDLPTSDSVGISHLMFSPDSRYLYAMRGWSLWQGDIESEDIASSFRIVLKVDTKIKEPLDNYSGFGAGLLAPDKKIYTFDGRNTFGMSVINHPDRPGLACDARYVQYNKPSCTGSSLGNQPNFNLGPIDGSPCDTLSLDNTVATHPPIVPENQLGIFPLPSTGSVTVLVPSQRGRIVVVDMRGRVVVTRQVFDFEMKVDLNLPSGIFIVRYISGDGMIMATGKAVIMSN